MAEPPSTAEDGPVPSGRAAPHSGYIALEPFDPKFLEPARTSRLTEFLWAYPQRFVAALRRFFAVVRVSPFERRYLVLRYDEVREMLEHDREFPVGWSDRMKWLTRGRNFVLGLPRGELYRRSYRQLAEAYPLEDVAEHVTRAAERESRLIVDEAARAAEPRLDAVEKLIIEVPARLCRSYFGIDFDSRKDPFGKWTLAISSYVFGWTEDSARARLGLVAATALSDRIRRSIAQAQAGAATGKAMQRLIDAQRADPSLDDDAIHAHLFGMVLGFIPTNVLAGGNILETLLRRPDFLARTRAAALAGDDELLWRCLREALRFRHINPGAWRRCPDGYVFGAGGPRPRRIPPGAYVLACIQSAMFDPRRIERPHVFDPHRRDEDYMVFGVGQHWCIGAYIAKAQLTQTFKVLLARDRLRAIDNPKVRTTRFNEIFPLHLVVGFDR